MYEDRFLTTEELAERWQVSKGTLERDRAKKQGVRYVKLGHAVRYRLQDVIDHENAYTQEPELDQGETISLSDCAEAIRTRGEA